MPRYHFNVFDGVTYLDHEGTELADVHMVRAEALRLAGELILEAGRGNDTRDEWRIEVTDQSGLILFRLDFQLMQSSAIGQKTPT